MAWKGVHVSALFFFIHREKESSLWTSESNVLTAAKAFGPAAKAEQVCRGMAAKLFCRKGLVMSKMLPPLCRHMQSIVEWAFGQMCSYGGGCSSSILIIGHKKWTKVIGWCLPPSYKLSNVTIGTKRLGLSALNLAHAIMPSSVLSVNFQCWIKVSEEEPQPNDRSKCFAHNKSQIQIIGRSS